MEANYGVVLLLQTQRMTRSIPRAVRRKRSPVTNARIPAIM